MGGDLKILPKIKIIFFGIFENELTNSMNMISTKTSTLWNVTYTESFILSKLLLITPYLQPRKFLDVNFQLNLDIN